MTQFRIINTEKEQPAFPPHACMVTGRCDGEIIDFGVAQPGIDPRLYLKREVVEEAARLIGMVPKDEFDKLSARLSELDSKYANLDRYRQAKEALDDLEPVSA